MEDGRHALPRPPRRVPVGAGVLTQLQIPIPRAPRRRRRPPRKFGRFLAGLLVVLLILGAGASAGWLIRAQSLKIDTAKVLDLAGPGVVRVLATTCAGNGEASGVVIGAGLVLTAASAMKQSLSMAIVTPDGRIRRANLLGTSADGVAVLRMIGRLDDDPVSLAPTDPDRKAERAHIGYTAAGRQAVQKVGTTDRPRALTEIMNTAKLGGPVLDKSGQVVGLVVGDTAATASIVPVARLREYVVPNAPALTPEPGGTCDRSRGPQTPIVPELLVSKTKLAIEAQGLLGTYLTLMNQHDFSGLRTAYYSKRLLGALSEKRDRDSHQTTYFFGARITEVTTNALGVNVRMMFTVLFSPNSSGAKGQTCNRLDVRYRVVREGNRLKVDQGSSVNLPQSCDTD
ncbi:serine protease [Kribbella sp. NPDC050281]|uniref:S1 family peptidase n=1 Tax=Kribbella sp. NPDC050281 TaxID=3155515 RepID=UPI0033CFD2CA